MKLFLKKTASKGRRSLTLVLTAAVLTLSIIYTTSQNAGLLFASRLYQSHNDKNSHNNANLQKNVPANRTLVIVMGELRAGEMAWETLYKNVLDPNSADLALMTTNNLTLYPNNTLMKRAKYVWYHEEYDDWADAIDLVDGNRWRTTHLPEFHDYNTWAYPGRNRSILFGGIRGHDGSGIIMAMMRWFLSQHITASGVLDIYDSFVVTRTDHYYLCPHLFSMCNTTNNTIWVPEGEEYGGYTDRHLVVSKENLLDALDIISPLITTPYEFDYEKHHNTERFMKSVWADKNLTVKKCLRSMFNVATKLDTTRWAVAEEEVPGVPGLFIKYRREYLRAKNGCLQLNVWSNLTSIPGAPKYILQNEKQMSNNVEKMKGPLLFRWNGTTHEEGLLFCKSRAGSRSICPYKAYCRGGNPFERNQRSDNEELWSPEASHTQPVWVSVGSVNSCTQRGDPLDESDKTKIKFILCCHEGEEEQAETMPDIAVKPELCAAQSFL
mmetsp:Transcript_27030/g.57925  ORF Transcript_27030/g.57925 Transcript_27030/m.57925 type:complete len:495 (+) Transcript_27030:108-1592(+)